MYDRLLKLLETQGDIRRQRPGTMAGGVGSGEAPPSKPFVGSYTASLTRGHPTRATSTRDAIVSQRKQRVQTNLHSGRKKS
jgi:hypothetical protein